VLRALAELRGIESPAIAAVPRLAEVFPLKLLDTQVPFYDQASAYPIPSLLRKKAWIDVVCSTYRPSLPLGVRLGPNTSNQDLEHLTFPTGSLDVVITSDVLEHVRLDRLAHKEIARVLRPGGIYLFTVPHGRSFPHTIERVIVHDPSDPARDEFALEPEYHGDTNKPDGRALTYRVYGLDLDTQLAGLGFEVAYEKQDLLQHGIVNTELFYCRKTR
jgi:SAM-dependent methyltransferase